eukprot:SAG22_NODE_1874_length_3390_cov_38.934366_2_plen_96_part_00
MRPHFGPSRALRGMALGGELYCRNISCWEQYVPYTAKLRALLGPSAIVSGYTNECALMGTPGWPENITIAPDFDFFSADTYQWGHQDGRHGRPQT